MTFMHIANHGLPTQTLGERRSDHVTAAKIRDALRACGRQAAAHALAYQKVDMATALRLLAGTQRRERVGPASGFGLAGDVPLRAGPFAPAERDR